MKNPLVTHLFSREHLSNAWEQGRIAALDTLALSLVALFAILVWFQSGMLITHEEMGFFFSHPERWVYQTSHVWWDPEATGFANPQVVAFVPFQSAMLILKTFGLSDVWREGSVLL